MPGFFIATISRCRRRNKTTYCCANNYIPKFTFIVRPHNGVVFAVCEHVVTENALVQLPISIDEATGLRIVIPWLQIVELALVRLTIATITNLPSIPAAVNLVTEQIGICLSALF